MNELVEDQTHHPLAFGSGALKGAAERWSMVEKEGFALVESLERFDFLAAGRELTSSTTTLTSSASSILLEGSQGCKGMLHRSSCAGR
jgi:hypothetical protein